MGFESASSIKKSAPMFELSWPLDPRAPDATILARFDPRFIAALNTMSGSSEEYLP
jgi:hypothetical protein